MTGTIGGIVVVIGVLILLAWAVKVILPLTAWGRTKTAINLNAGIDIAEAWAAYTALTAIRHVQAVESDPKAIEACEYLRGVVTAWKPPVVIPIDVPFDK